MPIRRCDDTQYVLGTALAAAGNPVAIRGGEYHFMASGTAGGGAVALQIQLPDGSYSSVQVFTGSVVNFTTLPGNQSGIALPACNVRVNVTGGATNVNAYLVGLG